MRNPTSVAGSPAALPAPLPALPAPAAPTADLRRGDCLEEMHQLRDGCADLVLTDPPYNTTNLDFDRIRIDWRCWWAEVHRVTTPQAIVAVFAAQPFATDLINTNRADFRYDLVWHKTYRVGHLSANVRPMRAHESVLIFCRRFGVMSRPQHRDPSLPAPVQSVYNPQFTEGGKPYTHHYREGQRAKHYHGGGKALPPRVNTGRRYPTSVLTYGRDRKSWHPTQKPLDLGRWLVRTYSHPGMTVLDPFAGGGNLPLAALLEGRNVIASEVDPIPFETMRRRVSEIEGVTLL